MLVGSIGIQIEAAAEGNDESGVTAEQAAVLQVEDDWVQAELNNDGATLRRVLDDRFVINHNDGTTSGKEDLIQSALNWNMTSQTITERTILVDGNIAVICGTTMLRFESADGEESVSFLRYTTTYVKREQGWRAIALHMARHATE
jgi:ketosteroid isomerase-like protein